MAKKDIKIVNQNRSMKQNDKALLVGLAQKDHQALYRIYDLYYTMIERMVINNSGNKAAAEDLFQESLIILYHKVCKKDFALTSGLQTFIYAICKRLWLKKLRDRKKHPIASFNSQEERLSDTEEYIIDHEEREINSKKLNKALEILGSPCKDLLEGFYIQEYAMKDLAEKFNYTNAANAKNQKYKCLQRLKKIFFNL